MPPAKRSTKHIFCLDVNSKQDLRDKSSILSALVFMKQNFGIDYIYKQCGTKENLQYYLNQWKLRKYSAYSIGYLSFHGFPGSIQVGKEHLYLEELAEMMEDSCRDKIIHFGSCLTLDIEHRKILRFLDKTGALCVCGYRSEINFLESTVFDMLLMDLFQQYKEVSVLKRKIFSDYRFLTRALEFKMVHL